MYSTEMDGERVEFGTSGFLYRSNKLMYDRRTNTLWHQFRGVPAVGPLAGSGLELKVLPMTLTVWSDWVAEHPDTTVLDVETGVYPAEAYSSESQNDSAYFAYRNQETTMFPVPERNNELGTKDQVFGLVFDGEARAYPLSTITGLKVINDTLADRNVVVIAADGDSGVRAYDRGGHVFAMTQGQGGPGQGPVLTDERGIAWQGDEDALISLEGTPETLERLPSRDAYWFGWFAFYPHTGIYSP